MFSLLPSLPPTFPCRQSGQGELRVGGEFLMMGESKRTLPMNRRLKGSEMTLSLGGSVFRRHRGLNAGSDLRLL